MSIKITHESGAREAGRQAGGVYALRSLLGNANLGKQFYIFFALAVGEHGERK